MKLSKESVLVIALLFVLVQNTTFIIINNSDLRSHYIIGSFILAIIYIISKINMNNVINKQLNVVKGLNMKNHLFKKYKNKDIYKNFCVFFEIGNLNHYKHFYSYEVSDYIINEVSKRLVNIVGKDAFHYFGTNEFVLMLEFDNCKLDDYEYRESFQKEKVEFIFKALTVDSIYDHTTKEVFKINIYYGISSSGKRNEVNCIKELVKYADFALNEAKKNEKIYMVANDILITEKKELDDFRDEILEGYKNGEFVPFYQPLIDAKTTKIIGCESLVRWKKDKYRIISPNKFLQAAKENQVLTKIDKHILMEAIKDYKEWRSYSLINENFIISINLSINTLYSLDIDELDQLVQKSRIRTSNIQFDLIDDILDKPKALKKVEKLKVKGFLVTIDNFSSKKIPFKSLITIDADILKIDRGMLPEKDINAKQFKIYQTITNMAHSLKLKVVSKGVENKLQLDFVRDIGVDIIQGYYFSEALDKEKFTLYLEKYSDGIYV